MKNLSVYTFAGLSSFVHITSDDTVSHVHSNENVGLNAKRFIGVRCKSVS